MSLSFRCWGVSLRRWPDRKWRTPLCWEHLQSVAMSAIRLPKAGSVKIGEVLDCLNHYRLRATYKAVGKVVGCHWRQVGDLLGAPHPLTSWVVRKDTGLPSPEVFGDDEPLLRHPDLERSDHVIERHEELLAYITAHRIHPHHRH